MLGGRLIDRTLRTGARVLSPALNPHASASNDDLRDEVDGRVVVVTGASYGIGEATARKLSRAGATTLIVARTQSKLDALAQELGDNVFAYAADLSDPDQASALGQRILAEHGTPHVVVSNAGKSIRRSIDESYERFHDYDRTIKINYLGPVALLLSLLPAMREQQGGHIVNVSTWGVLMPPAPRWSAYLASKAAFDVFLRSAAPELRADGVTVSTVYMGLVHTRMSAPTPAFRYVPGQTPREAAAAVCSTIVNRPRQLSAWWTPLLTAPIGLTRLPWELANEIGYKLTREQS